jgi:predicted GNAT family N-acyltransferase
MLDIQFKEVSYHSIEYQQTLQLRNKILRVPLGLNLHISPEDHEEISFHLVASLGDEVVACLVLKPISKDVVKLRQMAVKQELQGQKLGSRLVQYAEQSAKSRGFKEIVLHARLHAGPFYQSLGYEPFGEVFSEVTIPHLAYRKLL